MTCFTSTSSSRGFAYREWNVNPQLFLVEDTISLSWTFDTGNFNLGGDRAEIFGDCYYAISHGAA